MDEINVLATIYKQELAEANEQKVLFKAQCELYKNEIGKLKEQLKFANDEVEKLKNELGAIQNEPVEQVEAEIVQ